MSWIKNVLIFASGLGIGGVIGFGVAKLNQTTLVKGSNEEFISNDAFGIKDASDELSNEFNKQHLAEDLLSKTGYFKNRIKENNNDLNDQENNWTDTNNDWTDAYREQLSESIQIKEYNSKEDAESTVDGELQLVNSEIEPIDINKNEEIEESFIKPILAVDFIKAVYDGQMIKSLLFNPTDKKFYWNFTEELISDADAKEFLGDEALDDILQESSYNAGGWIQVKYLYDSKNNYYIKIETSHLN